MTQDKFTFVSTTYPNYSIGWNNGYSFNVYFQGEEVDVFSVMNVDSADDAHQEALAWLDETIVIVTGKHSLH